MHVKVFMLHSIKNTTLCKLSMILVPAIAVASICGRLLPWVYAKETYEWQRQAIGQDMLDLYVICPVLIVTTIGIYKKSMASLMWWTGMNLYVVYTFVIYCFTIQPHRLENTTTSYLPHGF